MKQHVTEVAATCYFHLRLLCQIQWCVSSEVTTQPVLALVITRLDYCNAPLAGLPDYDRTTSASTKCHGMPGIRVGSREHVTPCLLQLHWLPVCWCIQFQPCCIMHPVFNGNCPLYLSRHHSDSECKQTTSSPTIILINQLCATTTSHQVRRACLFSRWSVCMEQIAWRHSRRT